MVVSDKYKGYQDACRDIYFQTNLEDVQPYHIRLPEPPPPEKIINFGLPYTEQFFQRVVIPNELLRLDSAVKKRAITRGNAIQYVKKNKHLAMFVHSIWEKLTLGEWQYIRGLPVYITPQHFFQLNFCFNDGVLFSFRYEEALKSYWWDLEVCKSPLWYGGINLEGRRGGKTFFVGNRILFSAITNEYFVAGIQSKSELDAYGVFVKSIREPLRRLPFFLKPNVSSLDKTESVIDFSVPQKALSDPAAYDDTDLMSLNSKITYRDYKDNSYDGEKLNFYLRDEAGKIPDIDLVLAHKIVTQCLVVRDPIERIIGKAMYTSTIEELDRRGGKYFKALYKMSSRMPNEVDEFGRTKSGLAPYFVPGYKKEVFDQYGFSIEDDPLDYQIEYLKTFPEELVNNRYLKGGKQRVDEFIEKEKDPEKRQENIRLKPRNLKEAFRSSNRKPLFNIAILNERIEFFTFGYPEGYMSFGNFRRKNGDINGEVEWIPCDESQARFHVKRFPPKNLQNAFYIKNGERCPANTHLYVAGADPFKFNNVKYKASKGAGHVYEFFNPNIDDPMSDPKEWVTDNLCVEYYARPTLEEYCEDMLMMCEFFGCQIFPEHNVDHINKHFITRGRKRYLKHRIEYRRNQQNDYVAKQSSIAGGYTSDAFLETLYRYGNAYVDRRACACPFPRTLYDLANMTSEDRSSFDLAMSALYTFTAAYDNPLSYSKEPGKDTKKALNWAY